MCTYFEINSSILKLHSKSLKVLPLIIFRHPVHVYRMHKGDQMYNYLLLCFLSVCLISYYSGIVVLGFKQRKHTMPK